MIDTLTGMASKSEAIEIENEETTEAPLSDTQMDTAPDVSPKSPSEETERDKTLNEPSQETESGIRTQEPLDDTSPKTDSDEQEVDEPASLVGGLEYLRERIDALGEIISESVVHAVSVRVQVDENGEVKAVEIKKSTGNSALDGAIREIVRSADYIPAKKGGVSVTSWITLTIPLIT